jgi:hypothetical protein
VELPKLGQGLAQDPGPRVQPVPEADRRPDLGYALAGHVGPTLPAARTPPTGPVGAVEHARGAPAGRDAASLPLGLEAAREWGDLGERIARNHLATTLAPSMG